jgi:hypothetical protein
MHDTGKYDKYGGIGPAREKAILDDLEAAQNENPGGGGIPNPMTESYSLDANSFHHQIVNASRINGEASNAFYDFTTDSAIIGVNGANNISIEATPAGVVINNNGAVDPVATKAYVDANAGGSARTWSDSNGDEWGIIGVGTGGNLITEKVSIDPTAGRANSWVDDDGFRWAITGVSTLGALITSKI